MNPLETIRIDKWLWAARFFKTRSLASKAVSGGKIHLNGQRVKPSRQVLPGNILQIQRGFFEFTIEILGVNEKRRPAVEASLLYQETEESIHKREEVKQQRRFFNLSEKKHQTSGRPTKRDRRLIKRFLDK